jgi:hypothetical protein
MWRMINDNIMGGNSVAFYSRNLWSGYLNPVDNYNLGFVSLNKPIRIQNKTKEIQLYIHALTNEPRFLILQLNTEQYGYYKPSIKFIVYPNKTVYILPFDKLQLFFRGNWRNHNIEYINKNQINSVSLILADNNPDYFEFSIRKIDQK